MRHQVELDTQVASQLQAEEQTRGQQIRIVNQNTQSSNQSQIRDYPSGQQPVPSWQNGQQYLPTSGQDRYHQNLNYTKKKK